MKQPRFSIIVPCYNVSEFVSETIKSVLSQDYDDWELILINDGSTDSTLDILNSYGENNERIYVYDIPNGGVGKARNYGLEVAKGTWILFIDSDDWFETNALRVVNEHICKNPDSDIIGFNHYFNLGANQWKQKSFTPSVLKRKCDDIEWFKLDMMFPYYDAVKNQASVGAIRGVWGKAFKASIIKDNKLSFIENLKISEDAIFCLETFNFAKEVILFNDYLIHYRLHSSSAMNKYSPDVVSINAKSLHSYESFRNEFTNKHNFDICLLGMVSECLFRTFKLYLLHKKCNLSYHKRKKIVADELNDSLIKSTLANTTIDYLPTGKKQLIYCAKKKWLNMMFVIAFISLKVLEFKKK